MRTLTLRKETLARLDDDLLVSVVGASAACFTNPCITPPPPTNNLTCYLTGNACA